ncbi:DNA sulfur modification protein DndB [Streptomyces sp. NPDC059037]|uniref:DNA sulfur modification protein DndB n=1 Tax=Streptomyces sp. NPDC059037 TaxID=3346710 RepID=UPI0036B5D39F
MPKIKMAAMRYTQGGREMYLTAMSAGELVNMVSRPERWDHKNMDQHGNRPHSGPHTKGIVKYLDDNEDFVLGAAVLYLTSNESSFKELQIEGVTDDTDAATIGTLTVDVGTRFEVGDGQHRLRAYETIFRGRGTSDPTVQRLRESGQPLIIVIEDDPRKRGQDFFDLQQNVKPMTKSVGQALDRRQPISQCLDRLVNSNILLKGRVDYSKDTPGKNSDEVASFKTVHYCSGLILVGNKYRTPATMDAAVNAQLTEDNDTATQKIHEFWDAMADLPLFAQLVAGELATPEIRQDTYLLSANVLYAIALAVYRAYDKGTPIQDAVASLTNVRFERTTKTGGITMYDTIFAGNLVDTTTGKLLSGRDNWEAAADLLHEHIARTAL